VTPSEFIPVAEESGLICKLGGMVLRRVCADVAHWQRDLGCPDLCVNVNVSARQVAEGTLGDVVRDALAATGLAPDRLALEITERLLLEPTAATEATLADLRAIGVRVVLDDFGTGYSSLSYLRRYRLDMLKIDRAFVADLGDDGLGDSAIVEAIVGMARALGMPTIPEGVESPGQLARLAALGCDYAQGFHLGRPMPARELERQLR
jgi:EAL domain-containing protein (putative c-di-GMP-specific phosphodiesterase class I)